jgi:hypothetical protein
MRRLAGFRHYLRPITKLFRVAKEEFLVRNASTETKSIQDLEITCNCLQVFTPEPKELTGIKQSFF